MARASDGQDSKSEPLYMQVFRELQAQIVKGVYPVGTQLPSEAALVERFEVSRQTVRQALRTLRESGLVKSHQGLGTIVERPGLTKGYVHQVDTISDLFPLGVDTRYRLTGDSLARLPVWADRFPDLPGGSRWLHIRALRFRPGVALPFNEMDAFAAAAYAGVGRVIETHRGSIYGLIEAIYGEVVDEVEQTIGCFDAEGAFGVDIGMEPGEVGIEVCRVYRITSTDSIALVSINRYPAKEFNFSMKLRRLRG